MSVTNKTWILAHQKAESGELDDRSLAYFLNHLSEMRKQMLGEEVIGRIPPGWELNDRPAPVIIGDDCYFSVNAGPGKAAIICNTKIVKEAAIFWGFGENQGQIAWVKHGPNHELALYTGEAIWQPDECFTIDRVIWTDAGPLTVAKHKVEDIFRLYLNEQQIGPLQDITQFLAWHLTSDRLQVIVKLGTGGWQKLTFNLINNPHHNIVNQWMQNSNAIISCDTVVSAEFINGSWLVVSYDCQKGRNLRAYSIQYNDRRVSFPTGTVVTRATLVACRGFMPFTYLGYSARLSTGGTKVAVTTVTTVNDHHQSPPPEIVICEIGKHEDILQLNSCGTEVFATIRGVPQHHRFEHIWGKIHEIDICDDIKFLQIPWKSARGPLRAIRRGSKYYVVYNETTLFGAQEVLNLTSSETEVIGIVRRGKNILRITHPI